MTEEQISAAARREEETRLILDSIFIDWEATPETILGAGPVQTNPIKKTRNYNTWLEDQVGTGYFYADVNNEEAHLALMFCLSMGNWQIRPIPSDLNPLLEEDLERAVMAAGGTMFINGHYPLDQLCLLKLQESFLGRDGFSLREGEVDDS